MLICFEFKEFAEFIAYNPQTLSTFGRKIQLALDEYRIEKAGYESCFENNENSTIMLVKLSGSREI